MGHGGAQGLSTLPVQGLDGEQEAVVEGRGGAGRNGDALAGELVLDPLAPEMAVVARQADRHDQVVAEVLAGRGERGQLAEAGRGGQAGAAALLDLARLHGAYGQSDQLAGLAPVRAEGQPAFGATAPPGNEVDAHWNSVDDCKTLDRVAGPASLAGLLP